MKWEPCSHLLEDGVGAEGTLLGLPVDQRSRTEGESREVHSLGTTAG